MLPARRSGCYCQLFCAFSVASVPGIWRKSHRREAIPLLCRPTERLSWIVAPSCFLAFPQQRLEQTCGFSARLSQPSIISAACFRSKALARNLSFAFRKAQAQTLLFCARLKPRLLDFIKIEILCIRVEVP